MAKKNKKKLRIRSLILIVLFFYLIGSLGYYFFTLPIKNVYIIGTNLIKDQEILDITGLKNYPSLFKLNKNSLKKKIKKIELVDDVKISKNISGKVTIKITEAKPLFYYRNNSKIYLSNGKTVKDNQQYLGLPIVLNYVPSDILKDLIAKFAILNSDIVGEISEIEYSPDEKEGTIFDKNRFVFRMSDTNTVYIDTINLEKLNNYQKICATLKEGVHGYIYLNSNRDNASFKAYETLKTEDLGSE